MPARDEFERVIMSQRKYTAKGREFQEKIIQEHRRQVSENQKRLGAPKPIDYERISKQGNQSVG